MAPVVQAVNITSSCAGFLADSQAFVGADCGTKAFVAAFTESCRHDFVGTNIRWGCAPSLEGCIISLEREKRVVLRLRSQISAGPDAAVGQSCDEKEQ